MIDLTPLDVRKKKEDFRRTVRGYDPAQVDAFLELVADRLEQLVRSHDTSEQVLETIRSQLGAYQEREKALNEALLAAQELREEARSQAERDAAVRLREAETHAEAILLDADQAIRHSQRRLDDLRARRTQFLRSVQSLMERFRDYLDLEQTRLDTEPADLGALLEKLEGELAAASRKGGDDRPPPEVGDDAESSVDPGSAAADARSETESDEEIAPRPVRLEDGDGEPSGPSAARNGDSRSGDGAGEPTGHIPASRLPEGEATPTDADAG